MTWETWFVLAVLALTFGLFVWEKITPDVTAMVAFGLVLIGGLLPFAETLPDVRQMISVFANPAPLTVAAMFILSAALQKTGVIDGMANMLRGITRFGYRGTLLVVILGVALLSAFINNTPVVIVFLPVILSLARSLDVPASKMLIPLSYASIFGGTSTLVGTSTNLLASGILESSGHGRMHMFEFAWVGLPMMLIGALYLTFIAPRLLPVRQQLTALLSDDERKEYITEAFVRPKSELVGKTAVESGILKNRGVRVLEIIRNEVAIKGDLKNTTLEAGDRLVLSCRPGGVAHARSVEGLDLGLEVGLETISAHKGSIVEGIIGPRSAIAGKTIRELNFRQRFRVIIIAIHRRGINLRDQIDTQPLAEGDTILMMGTDEAIEQIRRGDDILLLDRPATPAASLRKKAPLAIGTVAVVMFLASFGIVPIEAAVIPAVIFLFLTGCVKPKEGYAAIDWSILLLIYGMLGVGLAMESTGTSALIAGGLVALTDFGIPPEMTPIVLLLAIYLVCTTMTEIISNNASVVLMTPIAIGLGSVLGVDPRGFVIAVCVAASASFATPIGYQTNTYVYGVGGYKFTDFLKVGLPMNVIYCVGTVIIVPFVWPFA
ncbi:MAG: anion permease [Opitutales bacterium]|nr:anion permease [Opitutales bacterium]